MRHTTNTATAARRSAVPPASIAHLRRFAARRSRSDAMTGIDANTGNESAVSTSSARLKLESRNSSSPTPSRPSTSPAAAPDAMMARRCELVVGSFGPRRRVHEPELFANLAPLQVGGDHGVFPFHQQTGVRGLHGAVVARQLDELGLPLGTASTFA